MEDLTFALSDETTLATRIKVIGIGGAGSNAVARMMAEGVRGVDFHVLNTDLQALNASTVPNKLAIGSKLTRGLGAGADPEVGRQAALEDTDRIIEILEGADMVFVTCGLGGGTGTGAAPVVAALAKELNALTVAVVTKPFQFEGSRRMKAAERGLADLAGTVDTVITIPNEKLLSMVTKGTSLVQAYQGADDVLRQAVQGISDIITTPGLVNRDFADIRSIMAGMGHAVMGTAVAEGDNAATDAAQAAMQGALMDQRSIEGACGLLINITGSSNLGLHDVNAACLLIAEATKNEEAKVNFGVVIDESMGPKVKVTVIATGFGRPAGTPPVAVAPPPPPAVKKPEPPAPAVVIPEFVAEPERIVAPPQVEEPIPPPVPQPIVEAHAPEPEPPAPAPPAVDEMPADPSDLDTPAFLRRERRLFQ